MTTTGVDPLPRELAPGLFWLGACFGMPHQGRILHTYQSAFLVHGDDASLLVEAGLPLDVEIIMRELSGLVDDSPPLRYLWLTHQETPHAGGVGHLLARYPDLEVVCDVHDYHLFFPQYAHRLRQLEIGEAIDLGKTEFRILEPVIRDLPTTQWGFDSRRRVLFPGDGFAYAHLHEAGQCGMLAEEVPALDVAGMTDLFAEHSLNWARFTDMEPYIRRLERLLRDLDVQIIAPTHGLPICDPPKTVPMVVEGLRAAGLQQPVVDAA